MHPWNVTVSEATEIQKEMQRRVVDAPLPYPIRTIAGADVSFSRFSDTFHACVVVFSHPDFTEIDRAFHTMRVTFPYVPGYLSFREVPVLAEAYQMLVHKPDVLVMDGHGIAHPRRIGVASHLGLVLDIPTIGCAKSKLFGVGEHPAPHAGATSNLVDPKTGDVIGAYVRTKERCKPIIVSPGHRANLEGAVRLVLDSTRGYRIPEPTRRAHELVNRYRKGDLRVKR
jgi:deoxyribonuclease V